ncbi:hypothetical protein DPMN_165060, partial [Dreissena polymorpha]
IFGVPMDICTEQYVQAVWLYSKLGADSSLREIHFVDIVPEVVMKIQTRFDEFVKKGELSKADKFGTSSLRYHNKPCDLGFQTETKAPSISEQELKDQGQCAICMDDFTNPKKLVCGHIICTDCISQQFAVKQVCPNCGKICGIITGDQPPGTMRISRDWVSCVGFEGVGRICISYHLMEESRRQIIQLREGEDVCRMLKVAFQRKLIFTIGSSRTTGEEGVITWNDIHHKTDPRPQSQFGYPGPSYLERVTDELKTKGVTHADINLNDKLESTIYSD